MNFVPDFVPDSVRDSLPDFVPDFVPDFLPDFVSDFVPDFAPDFGFGGFTFLCFLLGRSFPFFLRLSAGCLPHQIASDFDEFSAYENSQSQLSGMLSFVEILCKLGR